jgi:hypothetical protein
MAFARFIAMLSLLAGCDSFFGFAIEPDAGSERTADAASANGCPDAYTVAIGTKSYRFVAAPMKYWIDAEIDCRDDSSSAITHLPVFEDLPELNLVHAAVPLTAPWNIHIVYARDRNVDPLAYRAVTGAPLLNESTMWADDPAQPEGGDQTIVQMMAQTVLFDSEPQLGPLPYFCQCDRVAATEVFNLQ